MSNHTNGPLTDAWDVFIEWCELNDVDPDSRVGKRLWSEWPDQDDY